MHIPSEAVSSESERKVSGGLYGSWWTAVRSLSDACPSLSGVMYVLSRTMRGSLFRDLQLFNLYTVSLFVDMCVYLCVDSESREDTKYYTLFYYGKTNTA